jgi:hypothetical protein
MNEKFILTQKEMHLGFIKETFRAGAVIEYDEANGRLIIDGRKFDEIRDLDVLKRRSKTHPHKPWVIPYSEEAHAIVLGEVDVEPDAPRKPRPGEGMQVIQSDEDLNEEIDIRDTQISKRNMEAKEAERQRAKPEKMEIVRGDETVEERLARLKDKTDPASIAERVKLKRTRAEMPVVQDDSLGISGGSKAIAMNAGQSLPSREEAEAKSVSAKESAEARKKQVARTREKAGVEGPDSEGVSTVGQVDTFQSPQEAAQDIAVEGPEGAQTAPEAPQETAEDIDAQIAALQAKKAAMAPKEGDVARAPVTDESVALRV